MEGYILMNSKTIIKLSVVNFVAVWRSPSPSLSCDTYPKSPFPKISCPILYPWSGWIQFLLQLEDLLTWRKFKHSKFLLLGRRCFWWFPNRWRCCGLWFPRWLTWSRLRWRGSVLRSFPVFGWLLYYSCKRNVERTLISKARWCSLWQEHRSEDWCIARMVTLVTVSQSTNRNSLMW